MAARGVGLASRALLADLLGSRLAARDHDARVQTLLALLDARLWAEEAEAERDPRPLTMLFLTKNCSMLPQYSYPTGGADVLRNLHGRRDLALRT